jgi:flagellar protein FlbD
MIELTRLNGHRLSLNSDLIKHAESSPDTVITLVTGEKLIVREDCAEIRERVLEHRASAMRTAWPDPFSILNAASACGAKRTVPTRNEIES